jgi:transcription initiation factor TFIIH subunit 1
MAKNTTINDTIKEEIRLFIDHVKHKKAEGELFLMKERIAWMPKNQGAFTLSHRYEEIKSHKISTEGKSKVQLQIIMHDDSSATFHFVSTSGQHQQIKERDQVKDLLVDLLPKFRQKISKDLEDKKRILLENPNLYQLYNDLVVSSIISSEDFWNHYAEISKLTSETEKTSQTIGVSQRFLSNLRPKTDGSSEMKFNLTFDDKQSIFKTYPSVRQKYSQLVPHKMTEVDFWTKFIQSHYFHANKAMRPDDLFADCKGKDPINIKIDDEIEQMDFNGKDTIPFEGYGLTDFSLSNKFFHPNEDLVKHYNYYSMRILNSMDENNLTTQPSEHPINKMISETIMHGDEEIEDLKDNVIDGNIKKLKGSPLFLADIDRYIYGSMKSNGENLFLINNLDPMVCRSQMSQLVSWNLNVKNVTNSISALNILKELSPGSTLMNGSTVQDFQDEIPVVKKEEMKVLYSSLCELLRHFWACFPPTSVKLEAKFELMKNSLEGFQQTKITPFKEKLARENQTCDLTSHMENLINVALQRYTKRRLKQISSV